MGGDRLSELEAHLAALKAHASAGLGARARALEVEATALEAGDAEARDRLLRLVHQLRSVGGSVGRDDLSERAGRLETAIRSGASTLVVVTGARSLARSAAGPASPPGSDAGSPPATPARATLGWSVLVVDDEQATRQLVALTLGAAGCDVRATDDPEELLAFARARPAELAVLDAMMPDSDGLTLYRALREASADIRVAILSAALPEDLDWVLPPDPRLTWIRKPFRGAALIRALRAFVEGGADPGAGRGR